jgi:hypothetical protein
MSHLLQVMNEYFSLQEQLIVLVVKISHVLNQKRNVTAMLMTMCGVRMPGTSPTSPIYQ